MRKLFILRACIDLAFYLACFSVFIIVLFIPFAVLGYADEIPFKVQHKVLVIGSLESKLFLIIAGISSLIFLYSIYLLRNTIVYFIQKDLFNVKVIRNFNSIGICIIAYSLLINTFSLLYNTLTGHRDGFNLKIEFGFDSPLLAISLGLFFMVLSEVFKIAKNLKEENDLTL